MNGNGMKLVFGMNSFFFHFNSKVRVLEKFVLKGFTTVSSTLDSTIYEEEKPSLVQRRFITNVWHSIARTWSKKTTRRVAGHW